MFLTLDSSKETDKYASYANPVFWFQNVTLCITQWKKINKNHALNKLAEIFTKLFLVFLLQDSKQFRRATHKSGGDPQQQEETGGGVENEGSGSHGGWQKNEQHEARPCAAQEDQRSIPAVSSTL